MEHPSRRMRLSPNPAYQEIRNHGSNGFA